MVEETETDEPKRSLRRRASQFALVMVGAAVGGATVVLAIPRAEPVEYVPAHKVVRLFHHPDPMEFTVNPQVDRGHKTALITFTFSYRADENDVYGSREKSHATGPDGLGPVPKLIKFNWGRAYSHCLELLTNQRADTLMEPKGKLLVKRMLKDELTRSLFPEGMARVDDILWKRFVLQ